jgi:hypothetical protein
MNAASTTSDEEALGDLDERSIVVRIPENQPPAVNSITAKSTTIPTGGSTLITVTAADPDGDELTYIYSVTGGSITGSGSEVTYNAPNSAGIYTISVKVSDGGFTSSEKSIDVQVKEPELNHAPTIKNVLKTTNSVQPGGVVQIEVIAFDDDGDSLKYHYNPSGGEIIGEGSRVEWHAPESTGQYTISISVSDWELDSEEKTITFTVTSSSKEDEKSTPGFEAVMLIIAIIFFIASNGILRKRKR